MLRIFLSFLIVGALAVPLVAIAKPFPLVDVVRETLVANPEVEARWQAFKAAGHEQRAARGNYFPRIDVSGRVGYQELSTEATSEDFRPAEFSASLRQVLFDGFATGREVDKLGHLAEARYFDLLATAETVGLDAAVAYLDVLRYRELSLLAQENLTQHRKVFRQVEERVLAGITRGVDLDQATGRLALAESNLITETTNLHDVSARYLRIVGAAPPVDMILPEQFKLEIPATVEDALTQAFQAHPEYLASGANLLAAKADKGQRKSPFMPSLELRASHDEGYERSKIRGYSDEDLVELVFNYNLFSGGKDLESVRQMTSVLARARELRHKSCRDIRQTLTIAYHDRQRLTRQIVYLNTHQQSIAKAREAYRNQFDIGQRTLLDLLDTENEYFQARRAYVNSLYSLRVAELRSLAGMGKLLSVLNIRRQDFPTADEVKSTALMELMQEEACPAQAIADFVLTESASKARFETIAPDEGEPPTRAETLVNAHVAEPVESAPPKVAATVPVEKPVTAASSEERPEPEVSGQGAQRIVVDFPDGGASIDPGYLPVLAQLAETLRRQPGASVVLEGYPASIGPKVVELRLTRSRLDAIRNRLIYSHGIEPGRLLVSWFSAPQRLAGQRTPSEQAGGQVVLQLKKP